MLRLQSREPYRFYTYGSYTVFMNKAGSVFVCTNLPADSMDEWLMSDTAEDETCVRAHLVKGELAWTDSGRPCPSYLVPEQYVWDFVFSFFVGGAK